MAWKSQVKRKRGAKVRAKQPSSQGLHKPLRRSRTSPCERKSSGDPPRAALNARIAEVAAALRVAGRWDTLLPRRWSSLRRRPR